MTNPAEPVPAPRAFVLSTGSEIVAGLYADTNAMELSRLLGRAGFRVVGHCAVGDDRDAVESALGHAASRADLVVMTGGLGPTEDDLNREILAEFANSPLRHVPRAEAMMRDRFRDLGRAMPERNVKQAFVPKCAETIANFKGTAPGILLPRAHDRPMIVAMPGVPVEWRAMFERALPRRILPAFPGRPHRRFDMLHLAMIPESEVNQRLEPHFNRTDGVELGLLAQQGIIRVEITAVAPQANEADALLRSALAEVRALLPTDHLFGQAPRFLSLEECVVDRFIAGGKRLALAESCTGGGIARRITDVAGASGVLTEGVVTYSNEAKRHRLGVSAETLERHGAVSAETAIEMAAGTLEHSDADVALSVTGIAGPGGGTAEKPVGLIWFAIADRSGKRVAVKRTFGRDRPMNRTRAELQGLDLLRRWIDGKPLEVG